jgi:hypothetical protein
MPSHGIQAMLEECRSDAILLYDTCRSAETAVTNTFTTRRGVAELIAACGFRETAPGASDDSFTYSLTKELRLACKAGKPFTIPYLFSQVLSRLRNSNTWKHKSTPAYTSLVSDRNGRQIMLEPLGQSLQKKRNAVSASLALGLISRPSGTLTSRTGKTIYWLPGSAKIHESRIDPGLVSGSLGIDPSLASRLSTLHSKFV